MKIKLNNKSGIILYIVLWTLVILSILTIGVGWQSHIELTLAKHFTGKIQSKYLAISGLQYSINLIKKDKDSKELRKTDLFNPQLFSTNIKLGSGYFKIENFVDENSKINLNGINQNNYQIFENLLTILGADLETAKTISSSLVDWIDNDKDIFNPPYGSEDDFYSALGYSCKNKFLDSIEEISLVRGMNKNIYQKLKEFITIYPANGTLLINFETAPGIVLRAFAKSFTGAQTNTSPEDADSLVDKILEFRKSLTDLSLTAEERSLEINKISLNAKEKTIFLMMQSQRQKNPQLINIRVIGVDETTQASTTINATILASDLSIQRWQRN